MNINSGGHLDELIKIYNSVSKGGSFSNEDLITFKEALLHLEGHLKLVKKNSHNLSIALTNRINDFPGTEEDKMLLNMEIDTGCGDREKFPTTKIT